MNNNKVPVIAVDGPSGAGKGTIAKKLAKKFNFHYLDSGALYRVLALAAKKHMVDVTNASALEVLAAHMDVQFEIRDPGQQELVIFEGEEVNELLRTESCGSYASQIAQLAPVRKALLKRQHSFVKAPGLVADGRDMGTVVFPNADFKLFLTASVEERAKRRYRELKAKGLDVTLTQISKEMSARDARDINRPVAPLKPAEDAVVLDTTNLTAQQLFDLVLEKLPTDIL